MRFRFFSVVAVVLCSIRLSYAQNIDIDILKAVNPADPHTAIWRGASNSAYPVSAAVPAGLLIYGLIKHDKPTQIKAYEMIGGIVISAAFTQGLKITTDRQRPADKYPGEVFPYKIEHGKSFPSGHTSIAFATATSLALEYKKWYVVVPAYMWATSVGYSRMYLGEHYPSDVLGGAIIGTGSAILSHWLTKKIFK